MQPVGILLLAAAAAAAAAATCAERKLGHRCSLQEVTANLSSEHLYATWAASPCIDLC